MRPGDPQHVDDSFRRIDVKLVASRHGWIGSMLIGLPCCWCRYYIVGYHLSTGGGVSGQLHPRSFVFKCVSVLRFELKFGDL